MRNMLTAELAEFTEFKSVRVVSLVLHGCIVTAFASSASHSDNDSIVFLSHDCCSWSLLRLSPEKATNKKTPAQASRATVYLRYEIAVNKVCGICS